MINTRENNYIKSVCGIIICLLLFYFLYVLRSVLLPFVVGIIVAYFLDPLVQRLVNFCKMPRSLATIVILAIAVILLVPLLIFLGSIVVVQISDFVINLPQHIGLFGQKIIFRFWHLQI